MEQKNHKKSCFSDFAKYASLNVLGMLALSCYILADTFFVSRGLGADGLTALNLAIPVYSFIHGSGLMIGMGGGTRYSIQKNIGDEEATDRIFTHAVLLAACFALVFVSAGLFFSDALVTLLGADANVYDMTKTYLQVILLFAPAFLMNNVLLCFVRNDGAPQLAMAAMVTGSLSNVVLDYVFIFPCGMGIFGAVFATGLAPIISMLLLSVHILRRKNHFHLRKCGIRTELVLGIFSTGFPSLVTEVSSGIVMIVFNMLLLSLCGNTGVAAYGIIANLSLVVVAIYTGIAQGIQPLISSSFGTGDAVAVRQTLRYALTTMLILSVCIYGAVFFGASAITSVFNSEHHAQLQAIAENGLRLYFPACPFVGCNVILSIFFTSTEQPRPAHIISLLRGFFLVIPLAFVLSALAGMNGVWLTFPLTEAIVAAIGIACYFFANALKRVVH